MSFESALKVANAVLYEGYLLYPYRASAAKNQYRWQFGVVAPRSFSETTGLDPWHMQMQYLLEPCVASRLSLRARFLRIDARHVEESDGDGGFVPVEALEVDGERHVAWDEAEEQEIEAEFCFSDLLEKERLLHIDLPPIRRDDPILDAYHNVVGRYVRERRPIRALASVRAERVDGPSPLLKLTLRLENLTPWPQECEVREEALRQSLIAAHALVWAPGGEFISLMEPPEWVRHQAEGCVNQGCWPVLTGEDGRRDLMLASPIILYDHPLIAPESPVEFFDATEIDELLALRTMTLTDSEKEEARRTDPLAAALIEQADALPPQVMERLHGAVRYLREAGGSTRQQNGNGANGDHGRGVKDAPPQQEVVLQGRSVRPGDTIRIRHGLRASDAQDIFVEGRCAVVEKVMRDADDRTYLAVTLTDDPGADLQRWHGRFLYFEPHEVEPFPVRP